MGRGGVSQFASLAFASHAVVPIAPSGPIQKTSRCSGARDTAASKEAARAAGGGGMGRGGVSHFASLAFASHAGVPTAPSGPNQKTSRWAGGRANAAIREAVRAAFGGVMGRGGVSQFASLAFASHAVVPTAPSGPNQKTSRWSGVRATAAILEFA